MATRKIEETWKIMEPDKFWLIESQELLKGKRKKIIASGALWLSHLVDVIECYLYATANSPIDCLTGFPASRIYKGSQKKWTDEGESNGFPLKAKSTKHWRDNEILIETEFNFPKKYHGPPYKKRLVWLDSATWQIKRVEMTYQNNKTDMGEFFYTSEVLKIHWTLKSGYLNQMNVNFF